MFRKQFRTNTNHQNHNIQFSERFARFLINKWNKSVLFCTASARAGNEVGWKWQEADKRARVSAENDGPASEAWESRWSCPDFIYHRRDRQEDVPNGDSLSVKWMPKQRNANLMSSDWANGLAACRRWSLLLELWLLRLCSPRLNKDHAATLWRFDQWGRAVNWNVNIHQTFAISLYRLSHYSEMTATHLQMRERGRHNILERRLCAINHMLRQIATAALGSSFDQNAHKSPDDWVKARSALFDGSKARRYDIHRSASTFLTVNDWNSFLSPHSAQDKIGQINNALGPERETANL